MSFCLLLFFWLLNFPLSGKVVINLFFTVVAISSPLHRRLMDIIEVDVVVTKKKDWCFMEFFIMMKQKAESFFWSIGC